MHAALRIWSSLADLTGLAVLLLLVVQQSPALHVLRCLGHVCSRLGMLCSQHASQPRHLGDSKGYSSSTTGCSSHMGKSCWLHR